MQIPKLSLWICALAVGGALTIQAADTAEQAAARQALIDALNNSSPAATAPAAKTPAAQAAPVAPAATAVATPPAAAETPAVAMAPVEPQPGDTEAQAKARAALLQQMGTPAPAATVATAAPAKSSPAKPAAAKTPVMSSKEQKLQELLNCYKADMVTPQEYHEQRAAILAQP